MLELLNGCSGSRDHRRDAGGEVLGVVAALRTVLYSSKMYIMMILLKLDEYTESALGFTFQPCFLRIFCKGSGSMLIEYGPVIFYIYMAL